MSSCNRQFSEIMQESLREYRKHSAEENKFAENLSVLQFSGWLYPEKLPPGQENAGTGKTHTSRLAAAYYPRAEIFPARRRQRDAAFPAMPGAQNSPKERKSDHAPEFFKPK